MLFLRAALVFLALQTLIVISSPWPAISAENSKFYLLSNPIDSDVALGPVMRIVHPALFSGLVIVKGAALYAHTGEPMAGLVYAAFESLKVPGYIAGYSMLDLKRRQWWQRRKLLRDVAKIPGVTRVIVLTTGNVEFEGPLAARQKNKGYIFVETDRALEAGAPWAEKFGDPLAISSLSEAKLRLSFEFAEIENPVVWEPTLKEVFEKTSMPDSVAEAWTKNLLEMGSWQPFLLRRLTHSHEKHARIQATLLLPSGQQKSMGTLIEGRNVRKLLGLGWTKRGLKFVRAKFLKQAIPQAGAIPVCERILTKKQGSD